MRRTDVTAPGNTTIPAEVAAMRRALDLAARVEIPAGPNPRVACVILDVNGTVVAEGFHRGAGTPHAEVDALGQAGQAARGGTAVVTLEPCNHTGRTGPCTQALIDAGVARVVYAQTDPNPLAAGGARTLSDSGIEVDSGLFADESEAINRAWTFSVTHGRPLVTLKLAASIDGRAAAADGTSQWITSAAARHDVHRLRSTCDAILVGTGTALADDPHLTVRGVPVVSQPLRVLMGERVVPETARIFDDVAATLVVADRRPEETLRILGEREIRHLLIEGGPTIAAAFLAAGLVDEVVAYIAPVLLGAGASALADFGVTTIDEALRLELADLTVIGEGADRNLRLTLTPREKKD
jgi:diaminohydroxyphosphoribosylaminopyrimidine deaminase/5-amino-6-(5-phosphoribosylamino)uracil reductase